MASQAAVSLRRSDFARLSQTAKTLGAPLVPASSAEAEERERNQVLKAMSTERASKWPNTLAALRQKKIDDRQARMKHEEEERVALDKAEEELRSQERLAVIQRANALLLGQTAGMRAVHSQRLNSHTVDERQRQLELKARQKAAAADAEAAFHAEQMRRVADANAAEQSADTLRRARMREVAQEQKAQLSACLAERLQRLEAEKLEGAEIARRAAAAAADALAAAERKRVEASAASAAMLEANERLKAAKRAAAAEAAAALAATVAHADAKAAEAERRAAFIAAKQAEARERAAHISDIVSRDFAARLNDHESRIATQVADAHAKADSIEERRRLLQQQAQREMAKDRAAVLARQAAAKVEAERLTAQEAEDLRAKAVLQEQKRNVAKAAERDRARQLAAFHLAQMADKKRVFESAAAGQRDEAAFAGATAAGLVPDAFTETVAAAAVAVVVDEQSKGRSALPMERTLTRQQAVSPASKRPFALTASRTVAH